MEIQSQLEDVRKRIKDLETSLEHEEESSQDSSESIVFGTQAIPVAHRNGNVPMIGKPRHRQVRERSRRGSLLESDSSIVRPAMKALYRQFLGTGDTDASVEEFRDTLKALENLELEQKKNNAETFTSNRIQASEQKDKRKIRKTDDLDVIQSFIASGWGLLTAEEDLNSDMTRKPNARDIQRMRDFNTRLERRERENDNLQCPKPPQNLPEASKSNVTDPDTIKKKDVKASDFDTWRNQHHLDEKTETYMSQQFKTFIAGTEKALLDMKSELSVVRNEMKNVEKARGSLQRDQDTLRYETRRIRMDLQSACDSLRDNDLRVEDCCHRLSMLAEDGADIKEQIAELKSLESKKLLKAVETDGSVSRGDLQAFKKEHEALCGRILIEGEKEKAIIIDRVEHLSQLYLGGLEDVKAEVSNLKVMLDSSSSARSESLLAEMKQRSKKCLQIETSMRERLNTTANMCEKYNAELGSAIEKLQTGGDGHTGRLEQFTNTFPATRLEETAIVNRLQSLEEKVTDLASMSSIFANVEKHQEVIQKELYRLDDQMLSTLKRLDHIDTNIDDKKYSSLRSELDNLGQKVRDATRSRTVILDKMTEMGKMIRKIESAQVELVRSIDESRTRTSDLNERLATAESYLKFFGADSCQVANGGETATACVELLHTRVETLEGRVEHVASATITNLRILDSKVEHYRVGVQSAIDGAALAESKCGVLGAELVKVFRMLAARNGKLNDHVTARKFPRNCESSKKLQGNCKHCMKPAELPEDGEEAENTFAANRSEAVDTDRGQLEPILNECGKVENENSTFIGNYAESFYQSGQEFKKKLARSKKMSMPAVERFNKAKDTKAGCKSCQRTNIRFEAGRIHVNVCHRVGANRNTLFQPQN